MKEKKELCFFIKPNIPVFHYSIIPAVFL